MKSISIDIETFSSVPLAKAGVYKYAESEDFEILLFGYSVDGKEVQVVDLANGEEIPKEILAALTDETVTKWAFNAMFERVCLIRHLGIQLRPNSWRCSMIWAATLGLPLSLKDVGTVLRLDRQKMEEGKDLVRYFCIPCKETKSNGGRTRNLPADAPEKWKLFKEGDFDLLDMLYDSASDVLSQLIRTSFVPRPGCRFIVADYSAIEARVPAWLAGEQWVLDVFEKNGDIYCETASRMFHCTVEKHGENAELRQKGKQAVLSCGYGGSVGALIAMGAVESGMKEEELQPLVDLWRASNPHIVQLWWDVDRGVKTCVKRRIETKTHGIRCAYKSGILFVRLPSGRELAYAKPRIGANRFGGEAVTYEGLGMTKKWERIETFGGKLVENITQATARDILVFAMKQLRNRGFDIVMHVHDEIVLEVPHGVSSVEEICSIMAENPPWANGLSLKADGYECEFYRKD